MEALKKFAVINHDELIRRGYFVKFVIVSGRRLFLIDKGTKLKHTGSQFQIVMSEKNKVSMGRQIIEAQKGRVPHMYETQRVWSRAVELPIPKFGAYPAWEVK